MADVQIKADPEALAAAAAQLSVGILNQAIAANGQTNWLLAGGSAPMAAYRLLAGTYRDQVDWSKVVVAIGDERCVPQDSPDANWPLIAQTLLEVVGVPDDHQLRPQSALSAEEAAEDYAQKLNGLIPEGDSVPHFDLVWLGMGEDGHTLSLFPGHRALNTSDMLVVAVHNSPKPPPDRISLTLSALSSSSNCLVLAAGNAKAELIARALEGDASLPINRAINTIEVAGGMVTWLIDEAAASLMQ